MAGRRFSFPNPRNASGSSFSFSKSYILIGLFVFATIVCFSYARFQNPRLSKSAFYDGNVKPDRSFLVSLEKFLKTRAPDHGGSMTDGTFAKSRFEKIEDRSVVDMRMLLDQSVLKVYVYDMPAKFTYDLLWLFWNTYKETENLTSNGSPVHRLIEQHSIDYWLWADLIAPEQSRLLKNVVRVQQPEDADVYYIPFFTTISFFLLEKQQCKRLYREALNWVKDQPPWNRSEGKDHILPVHHPWSFKSVRRFMKNAIWLLPDMDSTGNWYKPGEVYLEKDVILPYVSNVEACDAKCLSESQPRRKTLLFLRGRLKRNAGGKIRAKLVEELSGKDGVVIEEGSIGSGGKAAAQDGMRRSIFCLNPAGDTPSSARLFDAILSGCIPVIISDELEPPFEGILDYSKMSLFVYSTDAIQPGWLIKYLRSIDMNNIQKLRMHLAKSARHFIYSNPALPGGPEDLTWRMISGKVVNMKLRIRRSQRMVKGSRDKCTCECTQSNRTLQS